MQYEIVHLFTETGDHVGYSIKKTGLPKLEGNHVYAPDEKSELLERLNELNRGADIRAFWPDMRDPEVLQLTEDPNWRPVEKEEVEVVDEENSIYVWLEEPDEKTGEMGRLDADNSIVVYKKIMAPKNPSEVVARQREAAETVAKKRAGIA